MSKKSASDLAPVVPIPDVCVPLNCGFLKRTSSGNVRQSSEKTYQSILPIDLLRPAKSLESWTIHKITAIIKGAVLHMSDVIFCCFAHEIADILQIVSLNDVEELRPVYLSNTINSSLFGCANIVDRVRLATMKDNLERWSWVGDVHVAS